MNQRKTIAINNKEAMQAANNGQYATSIDKLTKAVMLAHELSAPLLLAVSKNNMGISYQMAGRHSDAQACFTIARETIKEQGKGDDHPLLRVIDRNLIQLKKAA